MQKHGLFIFLPHGSQHHQLNSLKYYSFILSFHTSYTPNDMSDTTNPKLISKGSVASIINNLHKLEYESGRMDRLAQPKSRSTLTADHPAQKPRGDRPVPFHERPILRHYEAEEEEGSAIDEEAFRFEVPDLRHFESPEIEDEVQRERAQRPWEKERDKQREEKEEKQNPFKRRDSTGSFVSTPPTTKRESLSHKAFQRVRSMSTSPPLAMPVPRVEVSPWHESAEQYIKRKLTERWSPASRSQSISGSQASRSQVFGCSSGTSHVDAPLVQDILQNIDKILMEHTGTLRDVIDDSKRVLQEREVQCLEDVDHAQDGDLLVVHGDEDWRSETSTVPDLIRAVDRTAEQLGLSLPEYHTRHPELVVVGRETQIRGLSPVSPRHLSPQPPPKHEHQHEKVHTYRREQQRRRRRSSSSEKAHRILGISADNSGSSSPKANRVLGLPTSYTHHLPSIPSQEPLLAHQHSQGLRTATGKGLWSSRSGDDRPDPHLWKRKVSHPDHWHGGEHHSHWHSADSDEGFLSHREERDLPAYNTGPSFYYRKGSHTSVTQRKHESSHSPSPPLLEPQHTNTHATSNKQIHPAALYQARNPNHPPAEHIYRSRHARGDASSGSSHIISYPEANGGLQFSIEQRAAMTPSPALVEYDRFAALADRASRNSVNDVVDSVPMSRGSPNAGLKVAVGGLERVEEASPAKEKEKNPRFLLEEEKGRDEGREKTAGCKSRSSRLDQSWMQRREEGSSKEKGKGKLKRTTTMDRLREKDGYESQVKRVKQEVTPVSAPVPIQPIAKQGKRSTMKMMDSIMTRQGRDKEKSAGWKN